MPTMRRLVALGLVLLLALSLPAGAAERGTIRGRIVNETTGEPQAGVRVELLGIKVDRSDRLERSVTTKRDGTYRFENLITGEDWAYVIDARYDGGLFPGSPIQIPSDTSVPPVIDTTLKVWDTTDDPASVAIERDSLFAVVEGEDVRVVESVRIDNRSDLAYIGRGEKEAAGSSSTFGFPLPRAADPRSVRIEDASLDVPRLVSTSFGFAVTVAIPPEETTIAFSYAVSGDGGTFDLSRTTLYPTAELLAFAEDPLSIDGPRLEPDGTVEIQRRSYNKWRSPDALDAGDPVQMLVVAEGAPSWGIFAAAGAGIVLLVTVFLLVARTRRRRPSAESPAPAPSQDRTELVSAIAALDLEFETGEMSREEWVRRRAELKTKLQDMSAVG